MIDHFSPRARRPGSRSSRCASRMRGRTHLGLPFGLHKCVERSGRGAHLARQAGSSDALCPAPGRDGRVRRGTARAAGAPAPTVIGAAPSPIGQVTYAGRFQLTGLALRFEDRPAAWPNRWSSCRGRVESGRCARVLLAGRPAVQRARAASGELRKTPCYDWAHDELTNRCRIVKRLRPPFRYARARAAVSRGGSGASRPSRRDRRAEALPRSGVLLDVRLLRRRARVFRGRRLQPDQRRPRRTTLAGDPGGGPLGAGAPGRITLARAAPDHRQPMQGILACSRVRTATRAGAATR